MTMQQDNLKVNTAPFSRDLREKKDIQVGKFSTVHEFENDNSFIVKKISNVQDLIFEDWYEYGRDNDIPNLTWERMISTLNRDSMLLKNSKSGIADYIPPFQIVWGEEKGVPTAYLVMEKVAGYDIQDIQLWTLEKILQLETFITDCMNFYEESKKNNINEGHGYFPDILELLPNGDAHFKNIMFGRLPKSKSSAEAGKEQLYFIDTYPIFPILSDQNELFNHLKNALDIVRKTAGLPAESEISEIIFELYGKNN